MPPVVKGVAFVLLYVGLGISTYFMSPLGATAYATVVGVLLGLFCARGAGWWPKRTFHDVSPIDEDIARLAELDQVTAGLRNTIQSMAIHAARHDGEPPCASPACCGPTVGNFLEKHILPSPIKAYVFLSYTLRQLGETRKENDLPTV